VETKNEEGKLNLAFSMHSYAHDLLRALIMNFTFHEQVDFENNE